MRQGDNILAVDALGVDLMGFIFFDRSARYVDSLPSHMPRLAKRVGVFVNATIDEIERRVELFNIDYVQLHGAEPVEQCAALKRSGVGVIKAFSVDAGFDFATVAPYGEYCDMFIFDTACSGYGGSGQSFDWSLLDGYRGQTPFLLSGGISLENIESLVQFCHPCLAGYDLNSRFERSPAVKDVELLELFFEKLKSLYHE